VSSRINGRYVLWPSGLREFLTQHNLSHLSPLECLVSRLHDLSPRGEILEADTWPNQASDTCHVLTDFSILQMLKTYLHMAHIPCVHIIPGDIYKPRHFGKLLGSTSPPSDIIVPHHFISSGFGTLGVSILSHFQFSRTLHSRTGPISHHVSSWIG
jgi:hypothetical protein